MVRLVRDLAIGLRFSKPDRFIRGKKQLLQNEGALRLGSKGKSREIEDVSKQKEDPTYLGECHVKMKVKCEESGLYEPSSQYKFCLFLLTLGECEYLTILVPGEDGVWNSRNYRICSRLPKLMTMAPPSEMTTPINHDLISWEGKI